MHKGFGTPVYKKQPSDYGREYHVFDLESSVELSGRDAPVTKRVLMITSVASMIDQFNMPNIALLQEMGYSVEVACNFVTGNTSSPQRVRAFCDELRACGVTMHQIDFPRNVYRFWSVFRSYLQLKRLFEQSAFDFVHCQSPIGGVLGRFLSHKFGVRVIYTAHGFHFFRGASLLAWGLYYPVERFLAKYTDVLITINSEDYASALKFGAKRVVKVPGVGIDIDKFRPTQGDGGSMRRLFGLPKDSFVLLSVGELNKNKNHEVVIRALAELGDPSVHYVICGRGALSTYLRELAEHLGVGARVHLVGYQSDIVKAYQASDVFVFPSKREGLSVALLEAMASELPVVCSRVRGNIDLIENEVGGFLCGAADVGAIRAGLQRLIDDAALAKRMGSHNGAVVVSNSQALVMSLMRDVYRATAASQPVNR